MTKNNAVLKNTTINGDTDIRVGNTYNIITEMKIVFNEKKFKNILDLLEKTFSDKDLYDEIISPSNIYRDQKEKNKRHNLSEEDYRDFIVETVTPYELELNDFFKNPRNKPSIRIYKQLLRSFNQILRGYKKNFDNIFCFFLHISAKMKEKYQEAIEDYGDDLVNLFLYYSYYMCDLDKDKVVGNVFNS